MRHRIPVATAPAALAAVILAGAIEATSTTERPVQHTEVTYFGEVSRVLQANCVTCHRQGGIAPFGLESYEEAFRNRTLIADAVTAGRMPPWFASPDYGVWANDRSLSPESRALLLSWIAAGAPAGDPADAPPPLKIAEGWHIGDPDLVLQMEEPFEIPAEGVIPYGNVVVTANFPEDRWVRAVEIRPTAPAVTHHILSVLQPSGQELLAAHAGHVVNGIQSYFALMVPGSTGIDFGEGRAKRLPAGMDLVFQLHYTANGVATADQAKIGFIFADEPPREQIETASAFNVLFTIPPGARDYEVSGDHRFRQDGKVLSFMPHTHVRGVAFRYELVRVDGSSEIVLDLPDYDFDWQLDYILAEPIEVKAGDVMRATAWFDNSADNPANPDPEAAVRFGEQTWEEMMIGYFDWIPANRTATAGND
jgi:mono/diheme cytochrome c family protein